MDIKKRSSLVEAAKRLQASKTIEDYFILKAEIAELREEMTNLKTQKKKITSKRYVDILLKSLSFVKKRERLLRALSSCKPICEHEIFDKVRVKGDTTVQKRANLRALVLATRKTIEKYKGSETLIIRGLRGKPCKGYQLEIRSHFIKNY